jgi:hypothetical protein
MFDPKALREANDEVPDDPHGLRGCTLGPHRLASATFAQAFPAMFDDYVDARIQGLPKDMAAVEALDMIRLEIDMSNAYQLGCAMESNPYVKSRFWKVLNGKDIKRDLWTMHKAVMHLLRFIEDSSVRDTTRLNAVNSLNAMCGYVQLDENLQRRVTQTMRDFEKLNTDWQDKNGGVRLMN